MKFKVLLLIMLGFFIPKLQAQTSAFKAELFIQGTDTLPYRILYPDGFVASKPYPLILVLHGSGERGNDNNLQLVHGGEFFASNGTRANFPAVVVFPQCSSKSYWAAGYFPDPSDSSRFFRFDPFGKPTSSMKLLLGFIDQFTQKQFVDKKSIYLGGISMGGMATYELLYRRPDVFAAAFPICGGGDPKAIENYAKKVKIWAFHGAKDDVVLPEYTIRMVNAINDAGGDAKLTLYPEGNHGVWDNVFADPALLPWLFGIRKP